MFPAKTPMMLTDVTFTTEVEDEETHRIVVCTFAIAPFTVAHADALNLRTVLFEASSGEPRHALDAVVCSIAVEDQRLSFYAVPDIDRPSLVLPNVRIEDKLRAKIKHDREPLSVDAVLKVSFQYPTAEQLLIIASGVNETHWLTFEPEQGDLLTAEDDAEPIRRPPPSNGGAHGSRVN